MQKQVWKLMAFYCGLILLFQEKVLHNVMSIFTFMGASVMRQDDSYSFEVITKTLDTVIPALIQVCECPHAFIGTWI